MQNLNPQQRQSVIHIDSPLLVLAGAGSGKTRVITEKISRLLTHHDISAKNIYALTFTNKAAREMLQRVQDMMDDKERIKGLTISTFHSLGIKILRSEARHLDYQKDFSIIDPSDAIGIVTDMAREKLNATSETAEQIYRQISRWKNDAKIGSQVSLENPIEKAALQLYPDYQRYLHACNSMDIDDLVFRTVELLRNNKAVRERWQRRVKYLLVDEYQDTNGAQYDMVKLLIGDGKGLTVVGDDDQSIYAWRGAMPENIATLNQDFPGLKVVKLEQNYRSFGRILKTANHLIGHNQRLYEKSLWSELGYGEPIRVENYNNAEEEAEKIVANIMTRQFQENAEHGDFAILYRSNHQARIFELKLREMRIPYKLSGGRSFFERSEIRDVMGYLRLLTNQNDDRAFLRIINTPRRGIGAGGLEALAELANEEKCSLFEAIFDADKSSRIKAKQKSTLLDFAKRIVELSDQCERGDSMNAIETMLEEVGYERWLVDQNEVNIAERKWENIKLLLKWINDALETPDPEDDSENSLSAVISKMMLLDLLDRQNDDAKENVVNLMTLHAAKGLEFKHVYIVGIEEELLPHRNSIDSDTIDEERRLFYVGITRAMQTLQLSFVEKRKRYGDVIECQPSRFLDELPKDELQWDTSKNKSEEEKQQTGRAYLAKLRAGRT